MSLSLWFVTLLQNILTNTMNYCAYRTLKNLYPNSFPLPTLPHGPEWGVIYCIQWLSPSGPHPIYTLDWSLLKFNGGKLILGREWVWVGLGQGWGRDNLKQIAYRLLKGQGISLAASWWDTCWDNFGVLQVSFVRWLLWGISFVRFTTNCIVSLVTRICDTYWGMSRATKAVLGFPAI